MSAEAGRSRERNARVVLAGWRKDISDTCSSRPRTYREDDLASQLRMMSLNQTGRH